MKVKDNFFIMDNNHGASFIFHKHSFGVRVFCTSMWIITVWVNSKRLPTHRIHPAYWQWRWAWRRERTWQNIRISEHGFGWFCPCLFRRHPGFCATNVFRFAFDECVCLHILNISRALFPKTLPPPPWGLVHGRRSTDECVRAWVCGWMCAVHSKH